VNFVAKNVAEDAAARDELITRTGRMAVPVITIGDEVVVGYDRGRLQLVCVQGGEESFTRSRRISMAPRSHNAL